VKRSPWLVAGHYGMLLVLAFLCIAPIVVIFATSLRQQVQIFAEPLNFIFLPTLENYRAVLQEDKFDRYLLNSLFVGIVGGFNQSLQHVPSGGVDEAQQVEVGSIAEAQAAIAGQAAGAASRAAMAVLEGDRAETCQRGRSRDRWRVAGCRQPLIPTMRRYASIQSRTVRPRAHRAVPCVR
jgi:hypothetical protein